MRVDLDELWARVSWEVTAVKLVPDEDGTEERLLEEWAPTMLEFRTVLKRAYWPFVSEHPVPDPMLCALDMLTSFLSQVVENTRGSPAEVLLVVRHPDDMADRLTARAEALRRAVTEN